MALIPPNLDDRNWDQLLEEAKAKVRLHCPAWNDRGVNDPGTVLIEAFAYLTDAMIYRINRLPEKAFVEFLRLIRVQIEPPTAATVELRFSRKGEQPVEIPRGTRVTAERTSAGSRPAIFRTLESATIPGGDEGVMVTAIHGELAEAELLGLSDGNPGQSFQVRHAPILKPVGKIDPFNLILAVETAPDDPRTATEEIEHDGVTYVPWREVDDFADTGTRETVFLVDRAAGTVTFAPAVQRRIVAGEETRLQDTPEVLGATPPAGRRIVAWYRYGGGLDGNVQAGTLATLKDPIAGVQVTNPQAASGGRPAESLENALRRGPLELRSLRRAVTATDYELAAKTAGGISRAKAFTKLDHWAHAVPGTVEVLLVPDAPRGFQAGQPVTAELLAEQSTNQTRAQALTVLDARRPIGVQCEVNWTRYQTVTVKVRVVVQRGRVAQEVEKNILERLNRRINPIRLSAEVEGWPVGQTIHASHIYETCLAEPGVVFVDEAEVFADESPREDVTTLSADHFQPYCWFAAAGPRLFRSLNDGEGWELIARLDAVVEEVRCVRCCPTRAGVVAAVGFRKPNSLVYASEDCGESWHLAWAADFEVYDAAWTVRDNVPTLLVAGEGGLWELVLSPGAVGRKIPVVTEKDDLGLYAVATPAGSGTNAAAVATEDKRVLLSRSGGAAGTWTEISKGIDIRTLSFQSTGGRMFLWGGATAIGADKGEGLIRWELAATSDLAVKSPETFDEGWEFGSCNAIAFLDQTVFAATFRGGVATIDLTGGSRSWQQNRACRLPIDTEEDGRPFFPVLDVECSPAAIVTGRTPGTTPATRRTLACGIKGIFRRRDVDDDVYLRSPDEVSPNRITLPPTWLPCSGKHEITVISEDQLSAEARGTRPPATP